MRAPPCLETTRLRLRPRRREDIDAILQFELDPEVYRYSEIRPSVPVKDPDPSTLRKAIRSQILSGLPRNFWVVEWKDQPGLLGLAGLSPNPFGKEKDLLGFRFVRTAWGQGIGAEAARAILDHAFRVLKCPTVVAFSHAENWRSRRVLDKIGMEHDHRILVVEQRSLLSAPQLPPSARARNFLNIKSTDSKYLCYRLERGTYMDRVGPPDRVAAQPDLLR
jgi:RimJ/RimL family protein N-acetyltransferase